MNFGLTLEPEGTYLRERHRRAQHVADAFLSPFGILGWHLHLLMCQELGMAQARPQPVLSAAKASRCRARSRISRMGPSNQAGCAKSPHQQSLHQANQA